MNMNMKTHLEWQANADKLLLTLQSDEVREKYLGAINLLIEKFEIAGQKEYKYDFDLGVPRNEARAILKNLHRYGVISVSSQIRQSKPKPGAPVFTIAHTILDDPSIADSSWTDIRIKVAALHYLREKLSNKRRLATLPLPPGTTWEAITIKFLDGHTVKITVAGEVHKRDFTEMGFRDERTMNPNKQWELLRDIADDHGQIDWNSPKASPAVRSRKKSLADKLREYFGIDEDPFNDYRQEKAYRIRLTLVPEKQ